MNFAIKHKKIKKKERISTAKQKTCPTRSYLHELGRSSNPLPAIYELNP